MVRRECLEMALADDELVGLWKGRPVVSGAGCGPAGEWRDHVPIRMVTYGWTGWNQSATTWLLMHAAVNVRISQDRSAAGLGVARQEEDCAVSVGGWTVARLYVDKTWARIAANLTLHGSKPFTMSIWRTALPADGLRHRRLEIRRATHSLNRSHLVLIVSTVHPAAPDLPHYVADDGVRFAPVTNHHR